jgi:hypothetical protein
MVECFYELLLRFLDFDISRITGFSFVPNYSSVRTCICLSQRVVFAYQNLAQNKWPNCPSSLFVWRTSHIHFVHWIRKSIKEHASQFAFRQLRLLFWALLRRVSCIGTLFVFRWYSILFNLCTSFSGAFLLGKKKVFREGSDSCFSHGFQISQSRVLPYSGYEKPIRVRDWNSSLPSERLRHAYTHACVPGKKGFPEDRFLRVIFVQF